MLRLKLVTFVPIYMHSKWRNSYKIIQLFFSRKTTFWVQFHFLFTVWGKDVDATLECLPPLTLIIICFIQICVYTHSEQKVRFIFHLSTLCFFLNYYFLDIGILSYIFSKLICIQLLILLNCIKSDWNLWTSGEELKILRCYAETVRNCTLLYAGKYQNYCANLIIKKILHTNL